MAIFLAGYGNKNYRSFGGDGIVLDDLQDVNVIIGQNNGGKTNILRSLDVWELYQRGTSPDLRPTDYFDNDNHNYIEFEFVVLHDSLGPLRTLVTEDERLFIRYRRHGSRYEVIDSFVRSVQPGKLYSFCIEQYQTATSDSSANIRTIENDGAFIGLVNDLPKIAYVSEERTGANPRNIRDRLHPIWNHGAGNRASVPIKKALKNFIEQGVESKVELQFEEGSSSFTIEMNDELVPFESLGSGFRQIFDVALTIASISDSIVMIDEPELNMHPNLLRRLMKLIFANQTNQYIICTHSNVLLDASYEKKIYRVNGGKFSTVEECNSIDSTRSLLDDLGVRASDILQTNGIIWVEGPSDRTYIKHWLELMDNSLEEGLDYSFQYYGGKLLAHYTVDGRMSEFIDILDINKNAFIVIDSDWKNPGKSWTVDDLASRKVEIVKACEQVGVPFWITSGREIENYISDKCWSQYEGKPIDLAVHEAITDKSVRYKTKAKAAHEVVKHISAQDLEANAELGKRIKDLKSAILKWNNPT